MRALGGFSVLVDGVELDRFSAQPLRSALLTCIAFESGIPRERVMGLVWPEVDPGKARRRLNQLVLGTRKSLGPHTIVTRGDVFELGAHVEVDVDDFEEAVARGDHEEALKLYAGPFLRGLILVDNSHFEAWVESRRKHLAGLFANVVRDRIRLLSESGDPEAALELAHRWLRFDPFDEGANYELIALLGRSGSRADALRHFEHFQRSISGAGLGVVSRRLLDLVDGFRDGPEPEPTLDDPAFHRPSVATPRPEELTLAVIPFEALGGGDLSEAVARGLTEEIVSRLTRLDRLRVISRRAVARYEEAGYPSDALLADLGVHSVLEGSVQEMDGRVRVHSRVISTALDRYIWHEEFEGGIDDVLDLQGRIAAGIALALREGLSAEERSLVQSHSTTSGKAWMWYARAVTDLHGKTEEGLERAIASLETAIGDDPLFVEALSQLTDAYARLDQGRVLERFQGRGDDLDRLRSTLELATRVGGQFVAISGPPGIGKSTLLRRLKAELPEGRIMYLTRCRSRGSLAPFHPFADAMREGMGVQDTTKSEEIRAALARVVDDLDPALNDHLAAYHHVLGLPMVSGYPESGSAEELRRCVVVAIVDMIRVVSERLPVVLAIEDWQWADEGSKAVLDGIREVLSELPVVLLVTYRSDEGVEWTEPEPKSISLEPLTQEESDELICASFGSEDVSPELSESIWALASGNPFYVEEVCRSLSDGKFVTTRDGVTHLARPAAELPENLHEVVKGRITHDDRTADEAWTLGLLAVLGREASIPLLQVLAREDPSIMVTLSRLRELDLVASSSTRSARAIGLRHAITEDAALEASESREEMHLKVGRAFEELYADGRLEEHLEEVAHHFHEGGDAGRSSHYFELAGDRAFQSFSLAAARRLYRRAIDGLADDDSNAKRRAAVSFKWVEAGFLAAHPDQLDVLLRTRADARRLGDPVLRVRTAYWLGWVYYTLGNQRESIRLFEECERTAAKLGDMRFLAQVHLNLAYSLAAAMEYESAQRHFEMGVEQRRFLPGPGRSRGLAYAFGYLGMIHADRGHIDRARSSFEDAFQIALLPERRSMEASVRTQESFAHAFLGDWAECDASAAIVRVIATEVGAPYLAAMGLTLQGYAKERMGADGLEMLEEGVREFEASQAFLNMSWIYAALADSLARRGKADAARDAALSALARIEQQDRLGEGLAMQVLARVEALRDAPDWKIVQRHIDEAIAVSEERSADRAIADAFLCHADLLLRHGRTEEARAAIGAARARLPDGLPHYDSEIEKLSAGAG